MPPSVLIGPLDAVVKAGLESVLRREFTVVDAPVRGEQLLGQARRHKVTCVVADVDAVDAVVACPEFFVAGATSSMTELMVAFDGHRWWVDNPTPEEI